MGPSFDASWGSGRGVVRRTAPEVRLLAGAALFAGCLASNGATVAGAVCTLCLGAGWLLACGTPFRLTRAALVLGSALFLPYFLLLPLLPGASLATPQGFRQALLVPWALALRGLSGMLVCIATVSALSVAELREALHRLPVPSLVTAILLQLLHQTGTLLHETRRVAAAMAVRGASAGGLATGRVLFSLPQVWLPRILNRAERVGAAMELRGYCDAIAEPRRAAIGRRDLAVLITAFSGAGMALALRVLGAP